jgi:hypothetical protein
MHISVVVDISFAASSAGLWENSCTANCLSALRKAILVRRPKSRLVEQSGRSRRVWLNKYDGVLRAGCPRHDQRDKHSNPNHEHRRLPGDRPVPCRSRRGEAARCKVSRGSGLPRLEFQRSH